jgi:L-alanine-DL-glutamate epimerase-like enolase superfamily enzyme
MPITSVATFPVEQPMADPEWRFAKGGIARVPGHAIELTDANGVSGYGYFRSMPPWTEPLDALKATFDYLAEILPGRDETAIGLTMDALDERLVGAPTIKAGIECALYDLRARALGVPLHDLFGGRRHDAFPNTRIVPLKPPAAMAAVAAGLVESGFRHLKVKASGDAALDLDRLRAVREAVGPDIRLMVDANESYTPAGAIAVINRMAAFGIDLVEQPTPAEDLEGLARVARAVPVPIEADEGAQDFGSILRLVGERAVESINLRVPNLGGLTRTMRAAALCVSAGVGFRFGAIFGSSIVHAHTLHLAAALPAPALPARVLRDGAALERPLLRPDARERRRRGSSLAGNRPLFRGAVSKAGAYSNFSPASLMILA